MSQSIPVVLAIAGLDPSGGAGIQADIQTLTTLHCHCTPVVATLTVQDSRRLYAAQPVAAELLEQQLSVLADELHFSAIKLGALGSAENAAVVGQIIRTLKNKYPVPVVLDPVISASGGGQLSSRKLQQVLLEDVIPHCSVITPNEPELKVLVPQLDGPAAARHLASLGAAVLITGGHNRDTQQGTLENRLFLSGSEQDQPQHWIINTIDGEFRGTGCTFASAIAGFMAKGHTLDQAIVEAQQFVSSSIIRAYPLQSGQLIPQRATTS